jgi:eukaryotic-like serine/threonine-protein kinase
MQFRTRVWSAGKLVVIGGALLATYLLFAAASMRIALRAREVQVPDLTDHTASEATAIAANLGLTLKVDDTRRLDPKVAVGRVVAQDPAAGSVARRQRSLRVWLSAGQRAATMPLVVGETERAAQLRLAQGGLAPAVISEIRSHDVPTDIVVAQDPPAKSAVSHASLLVNRGERGQSYVMPDLIGVNGDRAADILRDRGFRVAVVGSTPYPGIAAGIVIRQSPQAGFQIEPGEPISLEVSR